MRMSTTIMSSMFEIMLRMSTTITSSMFEIMFRMSTTIMSSMFEIMLRIWASTVKAAQQAAPCPHACGRKAMRKTAMFDEEAGSTL